MYFELAEIFAQNAVLNPPFIYIPGVIEPVENESDLESHSRLSSIPEWHTPSEWEDSPPNPRASSDSPRIPSPVGNFDDNSDSLELPSDRELPVDELVSRPTVRPRLRPSQSSRRSSTTSTTLTPVARRERGQRRSAGRSSSYADRDVLQNLHAPPARRRRENATQDIITLLKQQKEIEEIREREKTKRYQIQIEAEQKYKMAQLQLERERFEHEKRIYEQGERRRHQDSD